MGALANHDYNEDRAYYACLAVLLTVSSLEDTLETLGVEYISPDVFAVAKSAVTGFVGMALNRSGQLLPRVVGELCLLSSLETTLLVGHKRFDFHHFLKHAQGFILGSAAFLLLPGTVKRDVREWLWTRS
eukprot:TRINITY_DN2150_c0_g1_i2.p2 TRINITY_DN2150_c0_g1~~TRINITY_DN2150_c0_g1_i2.p2  ORF type:complete len:130 (+),score=19.89 TRINITY_DN2150_c0_g1_i2:45-434(+)